ncbi:MAG: ABC-F family ATP-binding cassette domain-containing protein [Spirochaetales bacterium]|nr:ABC-F family ATP-binding cassette domain-containing protein [Spirochaetales bacterium]
MAFVTLNGVSLAFGDRDILQDVNLNISHETRAAIAGANGSGKTTFMRIMAGLIQPDKGTMTMQRGTRISYLPQSGLTHSGLTLMEEAEKAYDYYQTLLDRKEQIGHLLEQCQESSKEAEKLIEEDHDIQEHLLNSGYYDRKVVKEKVLLGLGFTKADFDKATEAFSGGWQMRIALAKILLENPDIMLLDEPTNYLDLEARVWLEDFINSYNGGVVVVSHDRSFLDSTVNEIYELFNGRMNRYKGNYTEYEKRRSKELESLIDRYKQQQEEIARIEFFIRRFRYQATKAKQVQSRIKYLESLPRIEIPESLKKMHFSFPAPPHSGNDVLILSDVSKAYGDNHVINHLDFFANRGEKIVFVGKNGAGKSTLMRIIAGVDKDFTGSVRYGTDVKIEYFSQDFETTLNDNKTVLEEVEDAAPTDLIPQVRNLLGAFLFRGDDIYKSVSVLSGGEKNRIALLKMLLHPANLLVLDEPTNHLDINSKDILLEALKKYDGTVLFVSHDKYFIENLADRVLELGDGKATSYVGDYAYYLEKKAQQESAALEGAATAAATQEKASAGTAVAAAQTKPVQLSREESKQRKRDLKKLERELEQVMADLDALEKEISRLNEDMAKPENYSDGAKIKELKAQLDAAEAQQETKTARWEELETAISELQEN